MAAATAQLASFETGHGDMVHDAAFDYFGKRLATCSSDRAIKVFDVVGEQVRGGVGLGGCQHPPPPAAARCWAATPCTALLHRDTAERLI